MRSHKREAASASVFRGHGNEKAPTLLKGAKRSPHAPTEARSRFDRGG
jgi:hypothetical protein